MSSGVFKVLYTSRGRLYNFVNVNVKTCILFRQALCFSDQIPDQLNVISPLFCGKQIVVCFDGSHTRMLEIEYTLKQTCLCECFVRSDLDTVMVSLS